MKHTCNQGCGRSIYVFRALPRPRRVLDKPFANKSKTAAPSRIPLTVESVNVGAERALRAHSSPLQQATDSLEYLDVPDDALRMKIIREWQEQTSTDALRLKTCAVCAKLVSAVEIQILDVSDIDLTILRNDDLPRKTWPISYNFAAYDRAILCSAGLTNIDLPVGMSVCKPCADSLSVGKLPKFALANHLYYGHEALPPLVKDAFESSSIFERMLVCRVRYNSVCCRFKGSEYDPNEEELPRTAALRNQRQGVRGNVMVTPLDVIRLNAVLPPPPEQIRDTMSVVFIGTVPPTRQTISRLGPVLVRKSRVKIMLDFLLDHNPYYGRLAGFHGYSEQNLDALFDSSAVGEDQGFPCAVHVGHLVPNDAIDSVTADYTRRNIDSDEARAESMNDFLMENVGYTKGDDSAESYWDMKSTALERCLAGKPFLGYRRGSAVVKDFDNPYLMTLAFPELDPWGIGGMLHPYRRRKIKPEDQVSHLLSVHGGRFQQHSEFAFFYHNVFRKQLVSVNTMFRASKNNYKDVIDKMLHIDVEQLGLLKEKCKRNSFYVPANDTERGIMTLMNSVGMIARHVPGSSGYKVRLRNEIRGMIYYRGAPTLFITLNPSDVDNPIVRLFAGEDIDLEDVARGEDMGEWERKLFAAKNPGPCAMFFHLIVTKFVSVILRHGRPGRGLFG
ncbi:hypothetical protein B0H16DRAFT_1318658, partial [Mycena metata]